MRIRLIGTILIAMAAALLSLAGCLPEPPVLDLPAGELDVRIIVLDTDPDPDDGCVPVFMQFYHDGDYIQLAGGCTASCNGASLRYERLLGYAARITLVSPGSPFRFVYRRAGVDAEVDILGKVRPVFVYPTAGATVARGSDFTITYETVAGTCQVRGFASGGAVAYGEPADQDQDGTYGGIDARGLSAGAGSISLTREYDDAMGAVPFRSVQAKYSCTNKIDVIWE